MRAESVGYLVLGTTDGVKWIAAKTLTEGEVRAKSEAMSKLDPDSTYTPCVVTPLPTEPEDG